MVSGNPPYFFNKLSIEKNNIVDLSYLKNTEQLRSLILAKHSPRILKIKHYFFFLQSIANQKIEWVTISLIMINLGK